MFDIRRRDFITLLGGMAATWPLRARAQQAGKMVSVGILGLEDLPPIDTFRQTLNELGYVEGKNVLFEQRYAKGRNERFPELANDLVGLKTSFSLGVSRPRSPRSRPPQRFPLSWVPRATPSAVVL
jgi:putative tryptophan/tyrosine transport system substrate-binding protein